MKVCYLIQTYRNPEQIYRLVRTLKKSSPKSFILISHNYSASHLDPTLFQDFSDVHIIRNAKGGRGDFTLSQSYLNAVKWLLNNRIEFDWLVNLTGQDYPLQPLPETEKFLATTQYDGFIEYFSVLTNTPDNQWGTRDGQDRYLYRYWRSGGSLSTWQRAAIKLPRMIINNVQPLVRVNSSYGLMVGIRTWASPFNQKFVCYAGSYFHTISRQCVEYVHEFTQHHPQVINYYKHTLLPEESLIQTILVNSGLFNLSAHNKRYIDWRNTRHGHPRTLTITDYPEMIASGCHFGRKFDMAKDSQVLDRLDARIFPGHAEPELIVRTVLQHGSEVEPVAPRLI